MEKRFTEKFDLDEMKGYIAKTTLASYGYEEFNKELTATIVFSAKDYKPHVILSVTCNVVTQTFGTDAKKAVEFYNSL